MTDCISRQVTSFCESRIFPLLLAFVIGFSAVSNPSFAEEESRYDREKVQLLVLLKLLPFVEWTQTEGMGEREICIGVWDERHTLHVLRSLAENLTGEGGVIVADIKDGISPEEIARLDILFFPETSEWETRAEKILELNPDLLVVGSNDGFLEEGGILNFVQRGEQVSFEVNNRRAREAGIIFRSRLLRLANRVIQ